MTKAPTRRSRGKPRQAPQTAQDGQTDAGASATKLDRVIALLSRPAGATISDLIEATGWQAHSVRGALSGALKRKRGLTITSDKTEGGRVYRISAEPAATSE